MRKFIVIFFILICLSLPASASDRSAVRDINLSKAGKMTYVDKQGRTDAARASAEKARIMAESARVSWEKRKAKEDSIPNGIPIKDSSGEVVSYAITKDQSSSSNKNTEVVQFVPVKGETAEDLVKAVKLKLLSSAVWVMGFSLIICFWIIFKQRLLNSASDFLEWLSGLVDSLKNKIKK
jgi:hypothetical protein